MTIKHPIEPNGDIQIFGDDGRVAVTVHPTELTEKGMADAVAKAERIAAMDSGNPIIELADADPSVVPNYHQLELLRAAWGPLHDNRVINIDHTSKAKACPNAQAVSLSFVYEKIKYTSILIAWPDFIGGEESSLVREGREHDLEAEAGTREMNVEVE